MKLLEEEITLFEIIMTLSDAIDLVNPIVNGHHKRVAYIVGMLASEMGFSEETKKDLIFAAAIHDIGIFSSKERVNALKFDIGPKSTRHAEIGYHILKDFAPLTEAADLIRYHHHSWRGNELSKAAGLLNLADRVDVLIDVDSEIISQKDSILAKVRKNSKGHFMPEAIEALDSIAEKEYFWFDIVSPQLQERLEEMTKDNVVHLDSKTFFELARIFSRVIDFRSNFTMSHSAGVSAVAKKLAELNDFSGKEVLEIEVAGFLHDLGKLAVPAEIINKRDKLEPAEYNTIKSHPFYTDRILNRIKGISKVKKWAAGHHERLDGSGYPFKLKKEELDLGAKIVAIADIFIALAEDRPYRKGMTQESIANILTEMADNNKIDKDLVELTLVNYELLDNIRIKVQKREEANFNNLFSNLENQAKKINFD